MHYEADIFACQIPCRTNNSDKALKDNRIDTNIQVKNEPHLIHTVRVMANL